MGDPHFDIKVNMVVKTFNDVFGLCSADVVLQAMSITLGRILFNCFDNPYNRREILERFWKQAEAVLTKYEKGM